MVFFLVYLLYYAILYMYDWIVGYVIRGQPIPSGHIVKWSLPSTLNKANILKGLLLDKGNHNTIKKDFFWKPQGKEAEQ